MKTYWITFGISHPLGEFLIQINAENEMQLRLLASKCLIGWCSIYSNKSQADEYCSKYNKSIIISKFNIENAIDTWK